MAVKVGFSGFGAAGRYLHAPLVKAAGMEVAAVATSRKEEAAETFPEARVVPDFDALLDVQGLDLVVVVTPNVYHASQVRAALEAGLNVVVDKPATPTRGEAEELADLAEAKGLKLAVYHNRRFDSDFLTLKKVAGEGHVGEIVNARFTMDRFRPVVLDRWRDRPAPASGNLYDLGSHLVDQALLLCGMPDWLQADVFAQRPGGETIDGFEVLMGRGRQRITLGVTLFSTSPRDRFRLEGDKGLFRKPGFDPQEDQLRTGLDPLDPGFGVEPAPSVGEVVFADGTRREIPSEKGDWLSFYKQMRAAIETGGDVPVTMREAARTIGVIEAAHASAREGRRIALSPEGHWT